MLKTPYQNWDSKPGSPASPMVPLTGRCIEPEEVAALTAFLLGPEAGAITGQQIVICGGSSL